MTSITSSVTGEGSPFALWTTNDGRFRHAHGRGADGLRTLGKVSGQLDRSGGQRAGAP